MSLGAFSVGQNSCYGDLLMLLFSSRSGTITRYSGDTSDWSKSFQVAYYLVITIRIKKIAKGLAENRRFSSNASRNSIVQKRKQTKR